MIDILGGASALAAAVAGLFFLRFWKSTRDRFFLYFATAFFIEGLSRVLFGPRTGQDIGMAEYLFYLLRLVAYGLILLAIWEKNRRHGNDK